MAGRADNSDQNRENLKGESKEFFFFTKNTKKLEKLKPYIKDGTVNLNALIIDIDTGLIEEGRPPHQRPLHACMRIADILGISFAINDEKNELVKTIHSAYDKLYRHDDLKSPPMHIGTVMFRDVFYLFQSP